MDIERLTRFMPVLGRGASRKVFALSPTAVLKVDRIAGGNWAGSCEKEASLWSTVSTTELATCFAPVIDADAGWLIMVRAESVGQIPYNVRDVLARRVAAVGVIDIVGNPGNVGTINGNPVAVDYAYQNEEAKRYAVRSLARRSPARAAVGRTARVAALRERIAARRADVLARPIVSAVAVGCADCGESVGCICHKMQFLPSRFIK